MGDPEAKVYLYHTDHLGSIKAVTNIAGEVVWNAEYLAFGTRFGVSEGSGFEEWHGFTGKEYDPDTGLYYFNARWYDAELGRFISEDPAADPNNPNLYTYCGNNPLVRIDPTGYFWDELGNLLSGKGWRESTEEEKAERRRNREQRSGLAGSSGQSSSSQNTSKPSKPKDELDELEEELNPGIPPDPVPELPKDGPTTSEEPNLGGNIYSVSYGIGGYVFVGGEVNVGFVMDDQGNYGVIFEVRAGTGVEVSLDIAKGLDEILSPGLSATSGNNETIYDLDGPTGMEASASFILNVTMDDKGNLSPNLSSIGFGGSLSWGYAKLIPVSDGVKWVGNKIKDYSNWLNENNYREPEMHVNNMKLITRADLFEMLNNYSSIPDDVMIPRR